MVRLFVEYWVIYKKEKLPNINKNAKVGSQFGQLLNKPSNIDKGFLDFTKVVKFRQIWPYGRKTPIGILLISPYVV